MSILRLDTKCEMITRLRIAKKLSNILEIHNQKRFSSTVYRPADCSAR